MQEGQRRKENEIKEAMDKEKYDKFERQKRVDRERITRSSTNKAILAEHKQKEKQSFEQQKVQ